MSLYCCGCHCGSTNSLIRNFLEKQHYPNWLGIPIEMGKDRSLKLLERLPRCIETDALRSYLEKRGKWAIIIGTDGENVRWSDLAGGGMKTTVEAELLVEYFGQET